MEMPASKRRCIMNKLDQILDDVQALRQRGDVFYKISNIYECVICKDTMQKPQYGPCCKRVIGCCRCVQRWFEDHDTCPHCSSHGVTTMYTDVRGMDDVLSILRSCTRHTSNAQAHPTNTTDSSDSDFELPAVNFRCGN